MLKKCRGAGFTLVELMIVVAILSVVAVLAVSSYSRYVRHSAKSEVYAMLGEIRAKQEAYMAESGSYLSATHTGGGTADTDIHPQLAGASEFTLKSWLPTADARWGSTGLGINPPRAQLYCGYVTIAGPAGTKPTGVNGANTAGDAILSTLMPGGANPTRPWFYARACCDFESGATAYTGCTSMTDLSTFEISSADGVVREHLER